MFATYTILAQASAAPPTASVVIVGFLFVMIVLALLAAITSAIGAVFIKQAAREAAKAAEAAQKAAESSQTAPAQAFPVSDTVPNDADEGDDPAILAVVAAAVHTVIGDRPHRVVSVRSTGPGWAQEGRRQIFSSHRVR